MWFDAVADGVQGDPAVEFGIANVTVRLLRLDGSLVASTTTNATGYWLFNSLRDKLTPITPYVLSIATDQSALVTRQPTKANAANATTATDSDAVLTSDQLSAEWRVTSPTWGVNDTTQDSGWVTRFHIGDRVFRDTNGDGVQVL